MPFGGPVHLPVCPSGRGARKASIASVNADCLALVHVRCPILYHRVLTVDIARLLEGNQAASVIPGIHSKRELCQMIEYINLEFTSGRKYRSHVSPSVLEP